MQGMINIVGIGLSPEDLPPRALKLIEDADILVGGKRHLAFFPDHKAKKIYLSRDVTITLKRYRNEIEKKNVVFLASGDPNFFGIAPLVIQEFGKKNVFILPNITAFQAAFARIQERWEDAAFISLHGRSIAALNTILGSSGPLVIYCDGRNSPQQVARHLVAWDRRTKEWDTWVFENLGQQDERISAGRLGAFKNYSAVPLAMMIIKMKSIIGSKYEELCLGIPDTEFYHSGGMITKRDVRILALSRLGCSGDKIFWDIGAGSGSVAIEAARLCPAMEIYAVERNRERFLQLEKNIKKFKASGVHPVLGSAPAALKKLPYPHSVFIGGSGGKIAGILQEVKRRIGKNGNIVINCVMIETLSKVLQLLKKWKWHYNVLSVQFAHLNRKEQPEILRPENPLFIIHATKT